MERVPRAPKWGGSLLYEILKRMTHQQCKRKHWTFRQGIHKTDRLEAIDAARIIQKTTCEFQGVWHTFCEILVHSKIMYKLLHRYTCNYSMWKVCLQQTRRMYLNMEHKSRHFTCYLPLTNISTAISVTSICSLPEQTSDYYDYDTRCTKQ
jgi:hypothetical protein